MLEGIRSGREKYSSIKEMSSKVCDVLNDQSNKVDGSRSRPPVSQSRRRFLVRTDTIRAKMISDFLVADFFRIKRNRFS